MQDYSGYGQPPAGPYGPTMPMPPMPPRPPRRRVGLLSYLLVALAAGALGAGSVVALYHPASSTAPSASAQPSSGALNPVPQPSIALPQPSSSPSTTAGEQAIVNKVAPGLVIINTTLQYNGEQAAATGMVITSGGLVLTNNHVIEDSTAITARTATGHQYQAKVVGYDVTGDIALIQLEGASGLRTVPLGNSSSVTTGASVVAMGNAEGQNAIVPVTGQVTALNQTITAGDQGGSVTEETLHNMIETNADIVSGDSGGPLADTAGDVIGMDTAGNDGGFAVQQSATGYSIPINNALAVVQQIRSGQASSTITIGYPPFMGGYIGQGSKSNPQATAMATATATATGAATPATAT
jgi:S1-C subfamily serine protease